MAIMLLFYSLQETTTNLNRSYIFIRLLPDTIESSTGFAATILLILIVVN
jgi:hypothetical protein